MSEDPELDALRKKRQAEIERQYEEQEQQKEAQAQYEVQKQRVLLSILTEEARTRLANIKMANPDFANAIESQLIQLSQSGRLRSKITDDQLKTMLRQLQNKKRDQHITFTRK